MIATQQPNGQGAALSAPAGQDGGMGGPTASAPGGSVKKPRMGKDPRTFAGMQQQGVARPSPVMAQQQQQAAQQAQMNAQLQTTVQQPPAPAGDMQGMLRSSIMSSLSNPGAGMEQYATENIGRQQRQMDNQFADSRGNLNENLAARGLDASTIAASGLSRLEERQAQASGDMVAQVMAELNRDKATAMQNAIGNAMGLRGQDETLENNAFNRNMATQRFALDSKMGEGQLGISQGNLQLGRDNLSYNQGRDSRDFQYRAGRDSVGDMQTDRAFNQGQRNFDRNFDYNQSNDTRNFDYRSGRDIIGDRQTDRQFDFNQGRDTREFNYRGARDVIGDRQFQDNFDYRKGRDVIGDGQVNRTFDYNQGRDTRNDTYRDSRDAVGDRRYNEQFDFTKDQARQSGIMDLMRSLGVNGMSPEAVASLMASLGIKPPGTPPPRTFANGGNGESNGGGPNYDNPFRL